MFSLPKMTLLTYCLPLNLFCVAMIDRADLASFFLRFSLNANKDELAQICQDVVFFHFRDEEVSKKYDRLSLSVIVHAQFCVRLSSLENSKATRIG